MEVKIFDNVTDIVRDDMEVTISKDSKVSIAAACFSMYAYKELKKQLESVDEFRFIFTSPTFVTEKAEKQKREFYIPRLSRERSLYGTEFEIKLRNEMTQKAIAKECADWIKEKARFKSNITGENMGGFMTVENENKQVAYMPINGFTTVDIGCERGNNSYNMINRFDAPFSASYMQLFLQRIRTLIEDTIKAIDCFEKYGNAELDMYEASDMDLDIDDGNTEYFTVGKKVKIELADMDYKTWRRGLQEDAETLELLTLLVADVTPEHDYKLQQLFRLLNEKMEYPINRGNKKVLIFSAFSDTAEYLYENVSRYIKDKYGLNTAVITGNIEGRTTIPGFKSTLNNVLTCFSPISKDRDVLMPENKAEIDILIATDCISEGQNLQDCDYLVNYDIHWNPVRIIQRFGRIDRIGSKNEYIQLVNFWPDMNLDEYINLKSRVETRMKISVMTSTGDDDPINPEEKGDLEYRKQQLKRLQEEVVDIEDMNTGISIMDLGLNEFRLDLLEYVKAHPDLEQKPKGLHAVVSATKELPKGVIFVLKNINNSVNIDNQNRIHPFYMVYIGMDGEIICDYLNPKKLLDDIRLLCRGKKQPIMKLCQKFNEETDDGRNMGEMSELLSEAIDSIIDCKEKNDIDSLFAEGGTSALLSTVSGLDDFELICFLVVK